MRVLCRPQDRQGKTARVDAERPAGGEQSVMPVRFANGSDVPVDSRAESGNRRGNHDRLAVSKSQFMNDEPLAKSVFGRVFARGGGASEGQRTGRSVRRMAVTATVAGEPETRGFMEPACL